MKLRMGENIGATCQVICIDEPARQGHLRVFGPVNRQHAEEIIKAVNNHDALVEFIERIVPRLMVGAYQPGDENLVNEARAVLEAVKEG